MDIVNQTLKLWRSSVFEWGERDCMLSIGDYIASRGARDVTGRFRGTYSDEAGALAHIAACGGCSGLVDLTGLAHTDTPSRGDVVVIDTGTTEVGALCTGRGIAARLERGVIEVDRRLVRIVNAWKFP